MAGGPLKQSTTSSVNLLFSSTIGTVNHHRTSSDISNYKLKVKINYKSTQNS
jgi:hypothetical protein